MVEVQEVGATLGESKHMARSQQTKQLIVYCIFNVLNSLTTRKEKFQDAHYVWKSLKVSPGSDFQQYFDFISSGSSNIEGEKISHCRWP